MADERQLRFLIAAGGTVGHVAPALAVAEALRRRDGLVTFAGSPDRVEARLVPELGYEFDAFAVSGLPRRPGAKLVRAAGQAVTAPAACLRILRRRRPDAVLGAGGYVAGPMVLAARLQGIPCALTEADAHLGMANRLAAPLAERVELVAALRNEPRLDAIRRPGERHLHAALPQRLRDCERRGDVTDRSPGRDQTPQLSLLLHDPSRC